MQKQIPRGKVPVAKPPAASAPNPSNRSTKAAGASGSPPPNSLAPSSPTGKGESSHHTDKVALRSRSEMEQSFERYRQLDRLDESVDAIGPNGITQLCSDLGIPFGELDMYVLVWKLGATQSSCITRSEWMHSMFQWKIEHFSQLRTQLPLWKAAVKEDATAFTMMYHSLYDFIRGDDEKLLAVDKALKAWQVLLPENEGRFVFFALWAQWVTVEYKRSVTRDLWRQLLEFADKIKKLTQYDPNDNWPTALDDFVEYSKDVFAQREAAQKERDAARLKSAVGAGA
jgi:hypothetical protein